MSASASSTFMWPGMRPAPGWMAELTSTARGVRAAVAAAAGERVVQLAHLVLRLGARHAVTRHDEHQARRFEDRGGFLGRRAARRALLAGGGGAGLPLGGGAGQHRGGGG